MTEEAPFADALRALIRRTGVDDSRVEVHTKNEPGTVASYQASAGRLTIEGTDPVAAAYAFARYLRDVVGVRITWETPRCHGLDHWPDAAEARVATPFGIRYHLNVVTHGYSTPFWHWDRWERELDWMALHGITHPLVLIGHEVVLAETLVRAGLDREAAAAWVGGAPHVPWMAMGGMHSFGGPLPARWATDRLELARQVLARARELGMSPVLPMTGGAVPPAIAGPDAGSITWQGWTTPVLDPGGTAYQEFGRLFLRTQRDLLGAPGPEPMYAVDPYIESHPPTTDLDELAAAGEGITRALGSAGDDARWLLQGWPFHYHREFWTPERVEALLSRVPHEKLLLIDLWGEYAPLWRGGMYGRRWIWTAVHNFGGRFALFGDLRGLVRDVDELATARPDRLEGVGLAPEAIENNTVFYELATDAAWGIPEGVDGWLDRFADSRYGVPAEPARQAWRLLGQTLYAPGRTRSIPSPVIARPWQRGAPFAQQRLAGEALPASDPARPSANVDAENDPATLGDLPSVARASRLLLELADTTPSREVLAHDVAELVGHVLAQGTRRRIRGILAADADGDADGIRAYAAELERDLADLDELCATRPESRVATWIEAARSWGATDAERAVLERDARSLVSVWGHQTSGLHDYSGRHWSGLIRDLYRPRWATWAAWLADAQEAGVEPDVAVLRDRIVRIEEGWRNAGTATEDAELSRAAAGSSTFEVAERILHRLARTVPDLAHDPREI